MRKIA